MNKNVQFSIADIKKIYNTLNDRESRQIFTLRLLFSLTGDDNYMQQIVFMTPEGKQMKHIFEEIQNETVTLFGAGEWGKKVIKFYHLQNVEYIIDNNKKYFEYDGKSIPVLNLMEYQKLNNQNKIIVTSRLFHEEIKKQLYENGVNLDKVINIGALTDQMATRQYFDLPYMKKENNEIFVDGGAFDGITSLRFMHWCDNKDYKNIYLFEPDNKNVQRSRELLVENNCKNFKIVESGLWNENGEICFDMQASAGSKVDENGKEKVRVCCMDDVISEPVTFIKLDIEGSELNALLGAKRIIESYKPKLAISIYHKAEDIWELPKLISNIRSDYKFYLRHYSLSDWDTILYAV